MLDILNNPRMNENAKVAELEKAEHLRQWQAANAGTKEPPPTAFTTRYGRAQVSEEDWVQSGQPALWYMEQQ